MGPSKVGVEKYHAWDGTLAIWGVSRGCFWPFEPTQYPRSAWGVFVIAWEILDYFRELTIFSSILLTLISGTVSMKLSCTS